MKNTQGGGWAWTDFFLMQVFVRPFATIREKTRCRQQFGRMSTFAVELQSGSRLKDLLEILELDAVAGVVAVSKGQVLRQDSCLNEGQEVALFPYLAGG